VAQHAAKHAMHPEVALPSAPPGRSSPQAVQKTQAVANALSRLGDDTPPGEVAEHIKARLGVAVSVEEVAVICKELLRHSETPADPGQLPQG
jgi:hypothetical protein